MKEMGKRKKMMQTAFAVLAFLLFLDGFVSTMILQIVANDKMSAMSGTVSLIGTLLAVLAAMFFMVKRMADQIQGFVEELDEVTEGKLAGKEGKLAEQGNELEEIVRSMNGMTENFSQIITGVKSATASLRDVSEDFTQSFQEMTASMEQISGEVTAISENTISQSEQTNEIRSGIMELNEAVEGIAEYVETLLGSTEKMKECSQTAGRLMEELEHIDEAASSMLAKKRSRTDAVYYFAERSQMVAEIVSGICGQTNLLALNASIEAAKAGEAGKGFALVAEEIQAFADQSRKSLDQINAIVNELTDSSNDNVDTTQKITAFFEQQTEKISHAKDIFTSLNQEMDQVSSAVHKIADQSAAWKKSKEAIDDGMASLSRAAEENTASARETLHAMDAFGAMVGDCKETTDQVKTVSKELIDHIGKFKITDFRER